MEVPLRGSMMEITANQAEELLSLDRKVPTLPK
jgi:hypothetical protein